jgi:hypothetical protein
MTGRARSAGWLRLRAHGGRCSPAVAPDASFLSVIPAIVGHAAECPDVLRRWIRRPAPASRKRATSESSRPGGVASRISISSSRNRAARRRPSRTDTSSSTTSATRRPSESCSSVRWRSVLSLVCGRSSAERTNARTRSTAAAGGRRPFPGNVISGRIKRVPPPSSEGSFTVHPSPNRCRTLTPQRARQVVRIEVVVESFSGSRGGGDDAVCQPVEVGIRNDDAAASFTSRPTPSRPHRNGVQPCRTAVAGGLEPERYSRHECRARRCRRRSRRSPTTRSSPTATRALSYRRRDRLVCVPSFDAPSVFEASSIARRDRSASGPTGSTTRRR